MSRIPRIFLHTPHCHISRISGSFFSTRQYGLVAQINKLWCLLIQDRHDNDTTFLDHNGKMFPFTFFNMFQGPFDWQDIMLNIIQLYIFLFSINIFSSLPISGFFVRSSKKKHSFYTIHPSIWQVSMVDLKCRPCADRCNSTSQFLWLNQKGLGWWEPKKSHGGKLRGKIAKPLGFCQPQKIPWELQQGKVDPQKGWFGFQHFAWRAKCHLAVREDDDFARLGKIWKAKVGFLGGGNSNICYFQLHLYLGKWSIFD